MGNAFRCALSATLSGVLGLTGCTHQVAGTPTATTTTTYSCQAEAASGQVFKQLRPHNEPFSISIPRLPGWQSVPTALKENQLALTKTIGPSRSYVALSVLHPEFNRDKAFAQLDMLTRFDSSLSITRDEVVKVCGLEASRLVGSAMERGLRFDFLNLAYPADGGFYPVQLRNQTGASDLSLFGADVNVMFRNMQIGP